MENGKPRQSDSYRDCCVERYRSSRSLHARVINIGRHPGDFLSKFRCFAIFVLEPLLALRIRDPSGASAGIGGLHAPPGDAETREER